MTSAPSAVSTRGAADGVLSEAGRIREAVVTILRERRGVDFTHYRSGTIERRIANRMVAAHVARGDAYLLLLNEDPETDALITNLTIKVSCFYRNPAVFDFLATDVIPHLRQRFGPGPLRSWSAGCASGEEAYTLALLLDRAESIVATDIDATALNTAASGQYGADALQELPSHLRDALALPGHGAAGVSVDARLRARISFLRHDLGSGAPPPGGPFHLVCCRNVLIYFTPPLQERAMRLLVDSLVPGGILCLGEAEWPVASLSSELEIVHRKYKVFRKPVTGCES